MGQTNDNKNPELILENLKSIIIKEENNTSLDKSFNTIRNIIIDYKFYKNIIDQNSNKRKTINFFNRNKLSSSHEYSKAELKNLNGNYDAHVIKDVKHTIERIKKWIKMVKNPYSNNNDNSFSMNDYDNFINLEASLNEIITYTENKSKDIKKQNKNDDILKNYSDQKIEYGIGEYGQSQKSKYIERLKKGPPDCFRWTSWCISNNLPTDRDNIIYENYTNMSLEKENKDRIIRDIERTFSDKNIEKEKLRKMETSLYKVLKAFWNLDKEIGYCQGMNLLVGFLLILSDFNERDTFYLLASNFSDTFKLRRKYEYNFRGLFYDEFPLLHFLNFTFEILLAHHVRDLKDHLENLGISIDFWMGKWFQTVFTIILPINWCKRLWDNIFADNILFMVKFGIAFSMMIKDDILKMEEEVDVLNYFKEFEKYSLCFENDVLNQKGDVYSIITKSQKIKIDVESFVKNYEKNTDVGKNFFNKMEKIENIKYHFYEQIVSKPTIQTLLFTDEGNNIKRGNSTKNKNEDKIEEKIIFEENSKDVENLIITPKESEKINLKKASDMRNTMPFKESLKNKIMPDEIPLKDKERKSVDIQFKNECLNNKDLNNIIENDNNDNLYSFNISNNNDASNNNINKKEESCNNVYCQNANEDIKNGNNINIEKDNIDSHQFENINENKLEGIDLNTNNNIYKAYTKETDLSQISNQIGQMESIGINIPKEDDISTFIGKNKFQKKNKSEQGNNKDNINNNENNNNNGNILDHIGLIFDKEKITQWCL